MNGRAAAPSRLSVNQRTVADASLREVIDLSVAAGLTQVGLWREPVAEVGLEVAKGWLDEAGLAVSSLCRGGFVTVAEPAAREAALADNRAAIDEAAALDAGCLVLVPGGLPAGDRDLPAARRRVAEAIAALAPYAEQRGVQLAVEPMNPIYAADRGVVSTLAQALELAAPYPSSLVGVVVDTFHLWWEPQIEATVAAAGDRIASYQISDWITPLPADTLLARGLMGDGHIDFGALSTAVAAAGYLGPVEVEIFNADLWAAPPAEVVAAVAERYDRLVAPYL